MAVARIIVQLEFTAQRTTMCVATAEWTSQPTGQFIGTGAFRLRLLSGSIAANTPVPGQAWAGGPRANNTTVEQFGPDGFTWVAANFVVRNGQVYTLRLEQEMAQTNGVGTMENVVLKARVYKR